MKDVASEADKRGIPIDRVGIRDLHLPVRIREKEGGYARVVGEVEASVRLPHVQRGTHMSRFLHILGGWSKQPVSMVEIEQTLQTILESFDAPEAYVLLRFKYFLPKAAPVSGMESQLDYDCTFEGRMSGDDFSFILGCNVPIITLCPCSREISDYGAHSQRAQLSVRIACGTGDIVWLEDLIPLLEAQGSCEIFPLLKRPDEKYVTETSYENPRFVEDVVRDTIIALRDTENVLGASAECESFESIHNHTAYAYAEWGDI